MQETDLYVPLERDDNRKFLSSNNTRELNSQVHHTCALISGRLIRTLQAGSKESANDFVQSFRQRPPPTFRSHSISSMLLSSIFYLKIYKILLLVDDTTFIEKYLLIYIYIYVYRIADATSSSVQIRKNVELRLRILYIFRNRSLCTEYSHACCYVNSVSTHSLARSNRFHLTSPRPPILFYHFRIKRYVIHQDTCYFQQFKYKFKLVPI